MDVGRSVVLLSDPLASQGAPRREAQPAALVLQQLRWLLCHQEAVSCCLPGDRVLISALQAESAGVEQRADIQHSPCPPQVHNGGSQQQEYLY